MATLGNFTAAVLTAAELNAIGTWTTWTPTWTNLTVGNGTVVARYARINKVVHLRLSLTFGSTTSVSGDTTFTLPVTASSSATTSGHGVAQFGDTGTASLPAIVRVATTTTAQLVANRVIVNSTPSTVYPSVQALSSTVPFTWANTDTILASLTYEAA